MAEKTFEPGTLDRTRRNIGAIDPAEALEMQKILGGEIIKERSVPIDDTEMRRRKRNSQAIVRARPKSSDAPGTSGAKSAAATGGTTATNADDAASKIKMVKTDDDLQAMPLPELKKVEALMMSSGYEIIQNYGLLNFLYRRSPKMRNRLSSSFVNYKIKASIDHLQAFISAVKTFIQIAPDTYKAKIATETELKFKFLRTVGKWTVHDIKNIADTLVRQSSNLTVGRLIPFVSAIYRELLTIYYIGEDKVSQLMMDIYTDMNQYPKAGGDRLKVLAKQAISEWMYICDQVIRGMYPLLMRMCAKEYMDYPRFFHVQGERILKFVGLTKFDILIPERKKKEETAESKETVVEKEKKEDLSRPVAGVMDDVVKSGLKILEQFFPEGGFSKLDSHPDLFPYFQPIYNFDDGFNMLNPSNPLQVTVVLLRIVEDLFQGCRNIKFDILNDDPLMSYEDSISSVFSDWTYYREDLFNKKYGDYLRQLVNSTYTQKDYPNSQYGKESITNLYWRARYYFLPNYKFNAPTLSKPLNDSKYKTLYSRTFYLRTIFTSLCARVDEAAAGKQSVKGLPNIWDRYEFEISNQISKRLDVLLGAKREDSVTGATNANLLKYTLCIISVLDWWLNNIQSPAYTADSAYIFRVSELDGAPEFSVPFRSDQNKLFADAIKARKQQSTTAAPAKPAN